MHDSYRIKKTGKKLSRWRSKFHGTATRLDYIFLSGDNENKLSKCNKIAAKYTDHDLLNYKLLTKQIIKGKGLWKFNSDLLKHFEYVEGVKKIIESTQKDYKNLKDKDMVKLNIRAYSIKFSAKLKKNNNN